MIKKSQPDICFDEIHYFKIFVSWSFDLIEGKTCGHARLLKRGECGTFGKWRNLIRAVISSTSVRKVCLKRKFMKFLETLWMESPYGTVEKMGSRV